MKRIVTTSFAAPPAQYAELADEVLVLPAVTPVDGTEGARRDAIKLAMIAVVEAAVPGDVCCQDDVEFTADPWDTRLEAGRITLLTRRKSARHVCPRAFRFADTTVRCEIVAAWRADPRRTCNAWAGLPMIEHIVGTHIAPS